MKFLPARSANVGNMGKTHETQLSARAQEYRVRTLYPAFSRPSTHKTRS